MEKYIIHYLLVNASLPSSVMTVKVVDDRKLFKFNVLHPPRRMYYFSVDISHS